MAPIAVVIGPPGSGKTTIGSALAGRLGVELRDTDADIEAGTGREISDIFLTDGEREFRSLERAAVAQALSEHDGVLALGGGAIESEETRALLQDQFVIRLQVSANEAAKRVGISGPRPLLIGNVRTKWLELMKRRDPWYAEVADITVVTDGRSVDEIVTDVQVALPGEDR